MDSLVMLDPALILLGFFGPTWLVVLDPIGQVLFQNQ